MELTTLFLATSLITYDYQLIIPSHPNEKICAKSLTTCELAQEAIKNGNWAIYPSDTETKCEPSPNCFSYQSNTIKGYNRK